MTARSYLTWSYVGWLVILLACIAGGLLYAAVRADDAGDRALAGIALIATAAVLGMGIARNLRARRRRLERLQERGR